MPSGPDKRCGRGPLPGATWSRQAGSRKGRVRAMIGGAGAYRRKKGIKMPGQRQNTRLNRHFADIAPEHAFAKRNIRHSPHLRSFKLLTTSPT